MMELWLSVDGTDSQHLYDQIYHGIKSEIHKGKLKMGDKLPSTRKLSDHLKVSRSTVALAYDQLVAEGYIEAVSCKGFFVAQIEEVLHVNIVPQSPSVAELMREEMIDFTPRGIDLDSFPYVQWKKIYKEVLSEVQHEFFQSGIQQGEIELREALKGYLYSARGVSCEKEQIIVGAGSEYLLMLLSKILGDGIAVGMENPTHMQAFRVFKTMNYSMIPISMDKSGMNVEELEESDAQIAYVMPSHQFPTGVVMPIKRRMELLKWASAKEGRYVIEDDYDSEFRYRGKPIPALQGMDKVGTVIYLGTFSKAIAPAIRVSYLVLPKQLLEKYYEVVGFLSSTVSRIDQQMLYRFISMGYFERHLNRMRTIYKNKQGKLLSAIKKYLPEFVILGENAGSHILLVCKKKISEEYLIEKAHKNGVKVYGLKHWSTVEKKNELTTIVLGYASLSIEDIELGIKKLEQAWKDI